MSIHVADLTPRPFSFLFFFSISKHICSNGHIYEIAEATPAPICSGRTVLLLRPSLGMLQKITYNKYFQKDLCVQIKTVRLADSSLVGLNSLKTMNELKGEQEKT